MDGEWSLPIMPTAFPADSRAIADEFQCLFPEYSRLTDNTQVFLIQQVRDLSRALSESRQHCPSTWTSRAYNLIRLGFPDLAAGDAWKAILLLRFSEDRASTFREKAMTQIRRQTASSPYFPPSTTRDAASRHWRRQNYINHTSDRATMMLAQALFLANCYIECHELLKDYSPRSFSRDPRFSDLKALAERAQVLEDNSRIYDQDYIDETSQTTSEQRRSGTITAQIYPWMSEHVKREDVILDVARAAVRKDSRGLCRLDPSTISENIVTTDQTQIQSRTLGVFATHDLERGDQVMIDRTILSGVDVPDGRCSCCRGHFAKEQLDRYQASCCRLFFCSETCLQLCMKSYHTRQCTQPLDSVADKKTLLDLENASKDTIAMNDLLYRVILAVENKLPMLPLRTPEIAAMIPAYGRGQKVLFSFRNDIRRPLAILLDLGNDPFSDIGLDTWVLQTIQNRIRNNVRSYEDDRGQWHMAVNTSYMFFNHSCEPNVYTEVPYSGCSDVVAFASRSVKAGEELFITYISDDRLDLPYAERQELLKDWISGECQCSLCRNERESLQEPPDGGDEEEQTESCFKTEEDSEWEPDDNRYASPETLRDRHPALKKLKLYRLSNMSLSTSDDDEDIKPDESPTKCGRSRRKLF